MIKMPFTWILLCLTTAIFTILRVRKFIDGKVIIKPAASTTKTPTKMVEDAYYNIQPLTDLDLINEEPIKIRRFKPKYYLTMGIENTTISDLIAMDKTYTERIELRKNLTDKEGEEVLAYNPVVTPSILELYAWLTSTYLPKRFPTVFTRTPTGLLNTITGLTLPTVPPNAHQALKLIGSNVDTDFLLLLPILDLPDDHPDKGKYRLEGFVTCFPSGFRTRSKLGLKLADIHGPVPGYAAKLEKSMDRFFAGLPVGRIVKRFNWTITTDTALHAPSGNHLSEEELAEKQALGGGEEEINIDQTMLRCERQTLHRLPKTKALVFAFKTYQYKIRDVRDEGCGIELADAIEGIGEGNAPGMMVYKRQVVWGKKVAAFLRGNA